MTTVQWRKWPLWVATGWLVLVSLVHTSATWAVVDPLLASNLEPELANLYRVLWHICTIVLWSVPLAIGWAAVRAEPVAARPMLVQAWMFCAAIAIAFLAVNWAAFGPAELFTLPQWLLFLPPMALVPFGLPQAR